MWRTGKSSVAPRGHGVEHVGVEISITALADCTTGAEAKASAGHEQPRLDSVSGSKGSARLAAECGGARAAVDITR